MTQDGFRNGFKRLFILTPAGKMGGALNSPATIDKLIDEGICQPVHDRVNHPIQRVNHPIQIINFVLEQGQV